MVVEVDARQKWNDTHFAVVTGKRYTLSATGTWYDASIVTGPEGYKSPNSVFKTLERFRRMPSADWFALVGAVDKDRSTLFLIGRGTEIEAPRDGFLTCFANDLAITYWNNRGTLRLEIAESTAPANLRT